MSEDLPKYRSFTEEDIKAPFYEVIIIIIMIIIIIINPFSLKTNTAEMIHNYKNTKWKSLTANASLWPIVTILYHIQHS